MYDRKLFDGQDITKMSLVGVDLNSDPNINQIKVVTRDLGLSYTFHEGDDMLYDIGAPVDTVFIDTWHVYGHLKRELKKYAPFVKKWIILHDTTVDAVFGESIRMRHNIDEEVKTTGLTREEITKGLWPAVVEFLAENPDFVLEHRYTNCNGLTILRRVAEPSLCSQ